MLNPVTIAKGLYQAARHPVDTGAAMLGAQGEQFGQAKDALSQGRNWEAAGHGAAAVLPILGPMAAGAGEEIAATGDIARGIGKGIGLAAPIVGVKPLVRGARAVLSPAAREATAAGLETGAASRVADVMAPKVGANKTRFGNRAESVAPALTKDLATDGAPLTREGLHDQVRAKLAEAETGLDAAAAARNPKEVIHTAPVVRGLRAQRATLEAQTHRIGPFKAGADVVPGPNAGRVAEIDRAIGEVEALGPVANYEALRRIRQAYDGPAKAVYSPSMTADYLKAQGSKLGAADVTGVIREQLAKMDPATAEANGTYSLYRTANDVLEATREVERTRPRVGRQIMARLTGVVFGGQQAGAAGAAAGYLGGPLLDSALSSGFTTKLKTAQIMQRMATAIRDGDVARVNSLTTVLQRAIRTAAPLQAAKATSPSESRIDTTPLPVGP